MGGNSTLRTRIPNPTTEGGRTPSMKRFVCCLFVLTVALTACSVPVRRNSPTHRFEKTYDMGISQEANTGTPMITIHSVYCLPSYKIKHEYEPADLPPISPDQEWIAFHTLGDNYVVTTSKYPYRILGIEIKPNGQLADEKPWIKVYNYRRAMQKPWKTSDPQVFIPLKGHQIHDGSFKAELIYCGITGNTINISYREFVDNLSRPAFHQELTYDLNESDQITFRSLIIRVLEADNAIIRFEVIDDGGLPWVPREQVPRG